MHGNGLVLKYEKPINENFCKKYEWILFLIIGVVVLVDAINHSFDMNTNPALLQFITNLTIDEIKISNPITYECSILILISKDFYGIIFFTQLDAYQSRIHVSFKQIDEKCSKLVFGITGLHFGHNF